MKIRAILRFRNEDLTRKRLIAGFKTQKELADHLGISQNLVSSWEILKNYPKNEILINKIEEALHYPIEDLFPPEIIKAIEKKIGVPIEKVVDVKQLPAYTRGEYLLPSPEKLYERKELEKDVENWLEGISGREKKILELRFGIGRYNNEHTLREIADIMKISSGRVQQIEMKALRRLRRPSRREKMVNSWL